MLFQSNASRFYYHYHLPPPLAMNHDSRSFCFIVDDKPTAIRRCIQLLRSGIKGRDQRTTWVGNCYTDNSLEGEVMLQPVNASRADSIDS